MGMGVNGAGAFPRRVRVLGLISGGRAFLDCTRGSREANRGGGAWKIPREVLVLGINASGRYAGSAVPPPSRVWSPAWTEEYMEYSDIELGIVDVI